MNFTNKFLSSGALSLSWIATWVQTNEFFQTIQLVLSIVGTAAFAIIQVIALIKKIKAKGKVELEDVEEGVQIVQETAQQISEHLAGKQEPNKKE